MKQHRCPMSARLFLFMICTTLLFSNMITAQTGPERVFSWDQTLKSDAESSVRWPVDVAAASNTEILVADAFNSRALLFRYSDQDNVWQVERVIQLPGPPVAVAHDGIRYLLSMRGDTGLGYLEGSPLRLRNQAVPSGVVPGAIASVPGGGFLVFDTAGRQVLAISDQGSLGSRTPVDAYMTGMASHSSGGFYAALADQSLLRLYDSAGRVLDSWSIEATGPAPSWPQDVEVSPRGDVVVVDRHHGTVLLLSSGGSITGIGARKGRADGLLLFPAGVGFLPDGRLGVADQGNSRVQIFRRTDLGEDR